MGAVTGGLLGLGYAASIAVLSRFLAVVRERRWRWLAVHHVGVVAIITGWALRGRASAAVVNSAWLVASSAWYALGGRRPAGSAGSAEVAGAGR